jgi:di/tricarboxylate transporter
LLLAALNIIPTAEAMLAGAAGMVLSGCLTTEDAYRAIEWKVVVLIAGMAPIGTALVATGLSERLGTLITTSVGSLGPLALVVALYSSAVLLTQVIGGQVTAVILGPIAVNAALEVQVNPSAVGVAVAMGCSVAFLTPIAHPVNILMMGPGGYTARDFGRVGLGMTLVCFVGLIAGMLLFWNLGSGSI